MSDTSIVTIPAITVWQPWASLIAEECKPFEFRPWAAPRAHIGKRIAIHAGARHIVASEVRELIDKLGTPDWRSSGLVNRERALDLLTRLMKPIRARQSWPTWPLGAVLCTAILGTPIRNEELARKMGVRWVNDSDRQQHSNWGWPLTSIERVEPPRQVSGKQGFWRWEP